MAICMYARLYMYICACHIHVQCISMYKYIHTCTCTHVRTFPLSFFSTLVCPHQYMQQFKLWNFLIILGVFLLIDVIYLTIWTSAFQFERTLSTEVVGHEGGRKKGDCYPHVVYHDPWISESGGYKSHSAQFSLECVTLYMYIHVYRKLCTYTCTSSCLNISRNSMYYLVRSLASLVV